MIFHSQSMYSSDTYDVYSPQTKFGTPDNYGTKPSEWLVANEPFKLNFTKYYFRRDKYYFMLTQLHVYHGILLEFLEQKIDWRNCSTSQFEKILGFMD